MFVVQTMQSFVCCQCIAFIYDSSNGRQRTVCTAIARSSHRCHPLCICLYGYRPSATRYTRTHNIRLTYSNKNINIETSHGWRTGERVCPVCARPCAALKWTLEMNWLSLSLPLRHLSIAHSNFTNQFFVLSHSHHSTQFHNFCRRLFSCIFAESHFDERRRAAPNERTEFHAIMR